MDRGRCLCSAGARPDPEMSPGYRLCPPRESQSRAPEVVEVFGLEESYRRVGEGKIELREEMRRSRQVQIVPKRCGLRDLVPKVLNIAVPEFANLCLIRSASGAIDESKALHLVEHIGVLLAGERRRRGGAKLIGLLQNERSHLWPLAKIRRGEIQRRQLIIPGLFARNKRRRSDPRAIIRARR